MTEISNNMELNNWAEKIHNWYLEVVKEMNIKSANPAAVKPYKDLSDEQKMIDIYIANKFLLEIEKARREAVTSQYVKDLLAQAHEEGRQEGIMDDGAIKAAVDSVAIYKKVSLKEREKIKNHLLEVIKKTKKPVTIMAGWNQALEVLEDEIKRL